MNEEKNGNLVTILTSPTATKKDVSKEIKKIQSELVTVLLKKKNSY
jgi:hypothetical protein